MCLANVYQLTTRLYSIVVKWILAGYWVGLLTVHTVVLRCSGISQVSMTCRDTQTTLIRKSLM